MSRASCAQKINNLPARAARSTLPGSYRQTTRREYAGRYSPELRDRVCEKLLALAAATAFLPPSGRENPELSARELSPRIEKPSFGTRGHYSCQPVPHTTKMADALCRGPESLAYSRLDLLGVDNHAEGAGEESNF